MDKYIREIARRLHSLSLYMTQEGDVCPDFWGGLVLSCILSTCESHLIFMPGAVLLIILR